MWQEIKNIYHLFNTVLANLWYGFPSRKLTVVGVTGTDGKTTTVSLIHHILVKAGHDASMVSSVGAVVNNKDYDVGFHVTTPSSWAIQRFLQKAVGSVGDLSTRFLARGPVAGFPPAFAKASAGRPASSEALLAPFDGVGSLSTRTTPRQNLQLASPASSSHFMVLEVTSHALDQYRVWGIDFAVGVLTNITHEHLDYHKTYENYVKTKARLLGMAKVVVINRDDESYKILKSKVKIQPFDFAQGKSSKLITYGMNKTADLNPQNFPFKTKLIGEFNKYNILAAIAACKALGLSDKDIRDGIESFEPPKGREEVVYKNNFTVMIDFAHTPNALEQILSSVRPKVKGRLIHVFGSAGERDYKKRPLMGKVSSQYADIIVLTAEDPRSESVGKIINEIELGIVNYESRIKNSNSKSQITNKSKTQIFKIQNRQEAISEAIVIAQKGDLILITGKAHEKSMNYGRGEEYWSEYEAVEKALKNRNHDEKD